VLVIATACGAPAPSASTREQSSLDAQVHGVTQQLGISGMAVSIISDDQAPITAVAGLANIADGVPLDPDAAFAIGSVTKTYTAALVMRAVADGHVALDDFVSKRLPDIPGAGELTVRDLLAHTSGLEDLNLDPVLAQRVMDDPARVWSASDLLDFIDQEPQAPGAGHRYTNTNYVVLDALMAAATGDATPDVLTRELLTPLGLESTWAWDRAPVDTQVPVGHGRDGTLYWDGSRPPTTALASAHGAAGGMAASVEDVARWGDLLFSGGVVSPATLDAMLPGPSEAYGLGIERIDLAGQQGWGHGGALPGFSSFLWHLPDEGVTIAVVTNQDEFQPPSLISERHGGAASILEIALSGEK
jgi:D-alanyl-D-alanine carboxypeptidase